ncbi:hypothetical protein GCM10009603_14030 [Nocardiopsis exhalans]
MFSKRARVPRGAAARRCGVLRMNLVLFCAITFVTRTARFLILVPAPAWAMGCLPG